MKEKLDDLKQQLEKQNFGVVDEKGKPKDSMFVAIDEKVVEFNNKHDEMKPLVQQHEQKLKELVAEANNAQKRLAKIDSRLKELDKDEATQTECNEYDELANEKQKLEEVLASLTATTDTDTDKPLKKEETETTYASNDNYKPASLKNYNGYVEDIMSNTDYDSIQPQSGTKPSDGKTNTKNKSKLQAQQTALNHIKADLDAEVTILKQEAETKKQAAAAAKTKKEQAKAESQTAAKDLETLSLSLNEKKSGVEKYARLKQNIKIALSNLQKIQSADTTTAIETATTAIETAEKTEVDDNTKAILVKANEALTKAKTALVLSNTQQPAIALSSIDTYIKDLDEALKSIPEENTAKESIKAAKESIKAAKESILNSDEYKAYDAASKEWSEEKQNEYKQKQSEIKAEEAKIAEKQKVVDAAKTAGEEAKKADEEAKKAEAKANGKIFNNSKTVSEMDVDNASVVKKLENLKGKIDTCQSQLAKFTKSKPTA